MFLRSRTGLDDQTASGCSVIVGAPITRTGGTVRRLRLWLENAPNDDGIVFLYWSMESEVALWKGMHQGEQVQLRPSKALGRWGRTLIAPSVFAIIWQLLRHRATIIVSFFPWTMLAAGIASRMVAPLIGRPRHVIHLAGEPVAPTFGSWARRLYSVLFNITLKFTDDVVVLSKGMATSLAQEYCIPDRVNIRVVPIAIDAQDAETAVTRRRGQEFVFGMVARLHRVKGCDLALRAFAMLPTALNARLMLYGTGPEEAALEALASELGIEGRVDFRGWIEDPRDAFRQMDCALLPSRSEGTPRSLLEAASVGIPTIATAVGGVPDLIAHGETGWLVSPEDAEGLSALMAHICGHPEELQAVANAALKMVRYRLSPEQEIGKILRLV